MKKWTAGMVLVLVTMLVCAGCGNESEMAAPADEKQNDPLAVAWVEDPVMVQLVENAGVEFATEEITLAREGGTVFEDWNEGVLTQIQTMGGESVISPQHLGHDIGDDCYGIDATGTCWVEWPGPPDAQDGSWYLYVRPDGEDPLLLDEGVYYYDRKSLRGNGVVMDYAAGNVIWIKPNGDYCVRLYRAATGDTLELDQFANAGAQVAIGAEDAVWVKRDADQQLYLMHCDLEGGEVTQLEQLEDGADNPVICGRFVVMHKNSGRDLWVYDLEQRAWTLHIGSNLPVFEGGAALDVPFVLDDRRIALVADTMLAPYPLAVVDLVAGTAQPLEVAPYTPLYYFPSGAKEETLADIDYAVNRIQPVTDDNTNEMMILRMTDDGVQKSAQPAEFFW